MPTSQNGYPANDRSLTEVRTITGTTRKIRVRKGAPGFLLAHFAAWFHRHIEDIQRGQLDDWSYAERPIRGSTRLSNHASGTAIDLNATRHPLGRRGTFTPAQSAAIRRQLRVYEGCIRWGGDYQRRADEMHFEINAGPSKCTQVARKLLSGGRPPSSPGLLTVDLSVVRQHAHEGGTRPSTDVYRLQYALVHGAKSRITVDGYFGPATKAAYAAWQRHLGYRGTQANGIPGKDSLTRLCKGRYRVID